MADWSGARRPGDCVLSEEAPDPADRSAAARVWIIDPLDGTREFGERPRTDWAVHVALWQRRRTDRRRGVRCRPPAQLSAPTSRRRCPPAGERAVRIAVSRRAPGARRRRWPPRWAPTLVPIGSAGAKCAAVWSGEVDAYVHAGGQYQWDSAAPVAVARAAGLHASRLDG